MKPTKEEKILSDKIKKSTKEYKIARTLQDFAIKSGITWSPDLNGNFMKAYHKLLNLLTPPQ